MPDDRVEQLQMLLLRMQYFNLKYMLKPILRNVSGDGREFIDTCSICNASAKSTEDVQHHEECAYRELLHDMEQLIF